MADQTLAQRIKAKYPGEYDDIPDVELERKVKAKYPGEYDDLPSTSDKPAAATAPAAPDQHAGLLDALGRAASSYWEQVNPVTMVKSAAHVVTDLPGAVGGLLDAQKVPFDKARESFSKGDYATGARHTLSYLIPVLGPMLDEQSDKAQAGDIAGSIGGTLGIGTALLAPEAAKMLPKKVAIPPVFRNRNPVEAEAVAFGQREGIPIDAGTATGSRVVKAAQHVSDRSIGGSFVSERARAAQSSALASTGERLASRAGPAATAEQAGEGVSSELARLRRQHHGEASNAYEELRRYEADPKHASEVPDTSATPKPTGPVRLSAEHEARMDDLLADARKHGYTGDRDTLSLRYKERLEEARSVQESLRPSADEAASSGDLLKEISKAGGIGIDLEKGGGYSGELESMIEGLNKSQGRTRQGQKLARGFSFRSGGLPDAPNIVVRQGGMTADQMFEHLRQDPRFADKFDNLSDFIQAVDESVRIENGTMKAPTARGGDVRTIMRDLLGVKEGREWWADAGQAPKTKSMGLAVDLAPAKVALKPLADRFAAMKEVGVPLQGTQARAAVALKGLMDAPDFAPLSVVDEAVGELKAMARAQSDIPELRNKAIGDAINTLDLAVKLRAGEAGDEVLAALERGRKSTRAKYAVQDVVDELTGGSAEPLRPYERMTAPKDSRIALARKIQQLAPNQSQQVARAYLDRLMEKATSEGGFGRAKGIAADWERLGPQTKAVLFKDPAYVRDLDNFFHLAKRIEDNPNPSGTAHTLMTAAQGGLILTDPITGVASQVGAAALSKLLHSPAGVKLLTRGMTIPIKAKVPAMALRAQLLKNGLELQPVMSPALAEQETAK